MKFIKKVFIFLSLFVCIIAIKCPPKEVISPCGYYEDQNGLDNKKCELECKGETFSDLKKVFERIAINTKPENRHLDSLRIQITNLKSLDENFLNRISFDSIFIYNSNLERIHQNALGKSAAKVKSFLLSFSKNLSSHPKPYDIFSFTNSLINAEYIDYSHTNINTIPKYALKLPKLKEFLLMNSASNLTIEDYAFAMLHNLEVLHLGWNALKKLPKNAFYFNNKSNKKLQVLLIYNNLTSSDLSLLTNFRRPVQLDLSGNKFSFVDEKVFKPFFEANSLNEINLGINPINCTDCHNYWLVKDKIKYQNRMLYNLNSSTKCLFSNQNNWDHCKK